MNTFKVDVEGEGMFLDALTLELIEATLEHGWQLMVVIKINERQIDGLKCISIFIDHEAGEIICLVASVRLFACLCVRALLFEPLDL